MWDVGSPDISEQLHHGADPGSVFMHPTIERQQMLTCSASGAILRGGVSDD